ncbi:type II toxin-antitoxin system PemK/MazF family toxin [Candidatus Micrarchaeota archaeon]|nr:type II toxin-antitoxin system PemK/MazF family toxin [Candidatus Micrarchaeota archaeon]
MVTPSTGAVVLVPFPFSDLSRSKLRPALVLANAGRGDWILCQITSNPYADSRAVNITDADFQSGSLRTSSYARPTKLFTANQSLITTHVGNLKEVAHKQVIDTVIEILRSSVEK